MPAPALENTWWAMDLFSELGPLRVQNRVPSPPEQSVAKEMGIAVTSLNQRVHGPPSLRSRALSATWAKLGSSGRKGSKEERCVGEGQSPP